MNKSKMLNSGENHEHSERVMKSKLCSSENAAPKYYMFKDHKAEGGIGLWWGAAHLIP